MAMKIWQDNLRTLYQGDCRNMSELPDESVHLVCTSPPYWGLRKYAGVPDLVFDGQSDCQHEWVEEIFITKGGGNRGVPIEWQRPARAQAGQKSVTGFCSLCNAWRGQLGQEPTPELYIKHIVDIFKEVRRVLRSDGVCFINIGDSYAANYRGGAEPNEYSKRHRSKAEEDFMGQPAIKHPYKPQDKCLIPFRLAIALQEDGWWIRQDIVWSKNNPMPESVSSPRWVKHRIKVKDRGKSIRGIDKQEQLGQGNPHATRDGYESQYQDCPGCEKCLPNDGLVLRHGSWRPTESHEYILMLTKTNDYYCDGEAVREKYADVTLNDARVGKDISRGGIKDYEMAGVQNPSDVRARIFNNLGTGRNLRSVWTFSTQSYGDQMCLGCGTGFTTRQYRRFKKDPETKKPICPKCGGTVWISHYATFPEKLPELCIKAGTSEWGVCAECGKPYARIIKVKPIDRQRPNGVGTDERPDGQQACYVETQTLGWKSTCSHKDAKVIPATVLDPFCGTGTTLYVAGKLGHRSVGYELSEDYCKLTIERNKQQGLL